MDKEKLLKLEVRVILLDNLPVWWVDGYGSSRQQSRRPKPSFLGTNEPYFSASFRSCFFGFPIQKRERVLVYRSSPAPPANMPIMFIPTYTSGTIVSMPTATHVMLTMFVQ